jgi:hypothetical protein
MTYNEIKFISEVVAIVVCIIVWFSIKWIEKRLGCKNDWELIALVGRKIKLLWQTGPKEGN